MASIFELLDQGQPAQPQGPAPEPGLGDLFSQGLRSAALDARGKINKLAGTAMDAAGLDGSDRNAASLRDKAYSQVEGKNLVPFDDVHDVRSGLRYGAGMLGGALPVAGAAAGASALTAMSGGAAIPAMIAGAATMLPTEVGGQLQRQDEDDANRFVSPADRLRTAVPAGAASALAQNIVPSVVGKLGGGLLTKIGADVAGQGAAGAAAEGIRQYGDNQLDPTAGYDSGKVKDAALEGGAQGAIFAGAHSVAHLAGTQAAKVAGLPGKALDAAKALVPDKPSETPGGAPDASGKASETAKEPDLPTTLKNIFSSAKDSATGLMEKIANNQEVATPEALAADPHAATAAADQTSLQFVKELGARLLNENLGPEKTQQLQDAMQNLSDKANQQTVAMIGKGQQAIATARDAVDRFSDAVGGVRDSLADATDAKKSEDFSGVRAKIGEAITGALGEDHPVLQDPATTAKFADAIRPYMERVASGLPLDSETLTKMMDVTGDKTAAVLSAVHDAIGDPSAGKEDFFKTLGQIDQIQKGRQGVLETMQKNLPPELQQTVRPSQLREAAAKLQDWAQRKVNSLKPTNEAEFHDTRVTAELRKMFGDKADVVLAAVEKNVKHEENILDTANTSERVTADGVSSVKYYGQNKQLYLDPAKDKGGTTKEGVKYDGAAKQAMRRAERDNPGAAISFKKASEIGLDDPMVKAKHADLMDEARTHGLGDEAAKAHADKAIDNFGVVSAEASKQETAINPGELDNVRLDTKSFGKSPSRIDAGEGLDGKPLTLDAIKLIKQMREKLKDQYTKSDDTSTLARTVNLFKEGIAAVQAHIGKTFEVPDSTQITPGKNGVTWGEAQRAMRDSARTEADKASDEKTQAINRLRAEFRAADSLKERAAIAKEGKKLVGEKEWDVIKEQLPEDDSRAPKIVKREDGVREIQRKPDRPESNELRSDNVHEDLRGGEDDKAIIRTNLDGSARADTVMGRRKPAQSVEGASPDPKAVAAKQAAFVEKARSGDKALLEHLKTSDDPKGLQRAVEHLNGLKDVAKNEHLQEAVATANARLAELVSSHPDVALGMQTKRYTLDLKHVSPNKFDMFDFSRVGDTFDHVTSEQAKRTGAGMFTSKNHDLINDYKNLIKERFGNVHEYNVKLNVATHEILDLVKPLKDQPPELLSKLRDLMDKTAPEKSQPTDSWMEHPTSATIKALSQRMKSLDAVRDALIDMGVKATHYAEPDEAGKMRGGNFVVLDPKVVSAFERAETKYSLMSTQVHDDLGRGGFAATHDSPIKHEGKFDWRTHALKGEGAMVKGAGTYLSTSDAVHSYYKKMFGGDHKMYMNSRLDDALDEARHNGAKTAQEIREWATESLKEDLKEQPQDGGDSHREALKLLAKMSDTQLLGEKSPTYHLSVDIEPHELMQWDKPLSDQAPEVRDAMRDAIKKYKLDDLGDAFGVDANPMMRGEDFYRELSQALGGDRQASDYLQEHGILGHQMKASAKDGIEKPNYVIYDDSKINTNYVHFSQERADPNATQTPAERKAVEQHIEKVLGPGVKVAWENILHAGEFTKGAAHDLIKLSVHALDPMSTAYHESLHGFFARLRDSGREDVAGVLEKAANAAPVLNQLRELLKNEPDALKQLADPEERAAYMYQFWANGKLNLGPQATTLFGKVAQFLRQITGLWTNDERALHVMEYFKSGEYQREASDPNALSRVLGRDPGSAFEKAKAMTEPLRRMGEALASAGGARLRDTGIPALRELADTMKLKTTSEGKDPGYLPAARAERARIMNQIGKDLKPYGKEAINEAMEALQNGTKAPSQAGRTVAKMVSKHLADALQYMKDAGVKIEDIGYKDGVPYFPRSWDASYISSHQRQFLGMLDKYVQSGDLKGDPKQLLQRLMVTDGAEFHLNNDGIMKPGMQFAKQRLLDFIQHQDAAPFMRKNMFEILNSYMTQATRRAEWSRRLGDDGSGLADLMAKAKAQGATSEQLETARKFVKAVDGTLGDNLDPSVRRLMGNAIVYQNLRLLPLAIFSSAVDAQGIIVRGGTVGEAFKTFTRGAKEMVKNFQSDPKDDKMTRLAEAVGTVDSAMMIHSLGASYSQGMVGNKARALNDRFFRWNLMEQYNTSMRVGATEAAMNFLVRHSQQPGQHSVRFLRELGLTASDVQLDALGRPKLLPSDGLSLEHSAKMKAAVNRWVDGAILRPDAVDKPVWMSDPHYALVAHLKQFVYAFHETILKRVAHEAANGNYSPAMALASYVPVMIAADYLKGMIQGGGQQPDWKKNWDAGDYAWSGMQRAGLFGVGQFGIDVMKNVQEGGSGIGALTGPTAEQLGESLQVLGGRENFRNFAIKSLPANALYASALHAPATDPQFSD